MHHAGYFRASPSTTISLLKSREHLVQLRLYQPVPVPPHPAAPGTISDTCRSVHVASLFGAPACHRPAVPTAIGELDELSRPLEQGRSSWSRSGPGRSAAAPRATIAVSGAPLSPLMAHRPQRCPTNGAVRQTAHGRRSRRRRSDRAQPRGTGAREGVQRLGLPPHRKRHLPTSATATHGLRSVCPASQAQPLQLAAGF